VERGQHRQIRVSLPVAPPVTIIGGMAAVLPRSSVSVTKLLNDHVVYFFLTINDSALHRAGVGRRAVLVGARWSEGMSSREVQADENLLSAFASMIGGALVVGFPMALVIIWVCS
jgi:hypothetical protein